MEPDDPLRVEVERKFGRNALLFQRLEAVLKWLVGTNNVSGYDTDLLSNRDLKVAAMQKQTLGYVVQQFARDMQPGAAAADDAPEDLVGAWLSVSFKAGLTDAEHEHLCQTLATVVGDRNELIHHLFQRFDIDSPEGAGEAILHLDQQHADAKVAWSRVKGIAASIKEAREAMLPILRSDQYKDFFLFHLGHGGRVAALLRSFTADKGDSEGWADLAGVGRLLAQEIPDELASLKKYYGEQSLKGLLLSTGLYECREEPTPKGGVRTLFRETTPFAR